METDILEECNAEQQQECLQTDSRFRLKKFFTVRVPHQVTQEQVTQKSWGCPITGSV